MTVSQTVQTKLEEAFGTDYWKQTFSKIHDEEPDIMRYNVFYKHGRATQIGESKMFTGKYAFKHAKEYIDKLD